MYASLTGVTCSTEVISIQSTVWACRRSAVLLEWAPDVRAPTEASSSRRSSWYTCWGCGGREKWSDPESPTRAPKKALVRLCMQAWQGFNKQNTNAVLKVVCFVRNLLFASAQCLVSRGIPRSLEKTGALKAKTGELLLFWAARDRLFGI